MTSLVRSKKQSLHDQLLKLADPLSKPMILIHSSSDQWVAISVGWKVRGGIKNIPDWCRHLYSSCGSAKHQSQHAKL
jgi:hypothetical protein